MDELEAANEDILNEAFVDSATSPTSGVQEQDRCSLDSACDLNSPKFEFELHEESDAFGRTSIKGRTEWYEKSRFPRYIEYGTDYNLMTGRKQRKEDAVIPHEAISPIVTQFLARKEGGRQFSDLFPTEIPETRYLVQSTCYGADEAYWTHYMNDEGLRHLTTATLQKLVCAALNCRKLLKLVFGVTPDGKILGVYVSGEERDSIRQGVDFAMCREFLPELDPGVYRVEFLPVSNMSRQPVADCYLVQFTLNSTSDRIYQLSSGRVFFPSENAGKIFEQINSLNEIKKFLVGKYERESKGRCHLIEKAVQKVDLYDKQRSTRDLKAFGAGALLCACAGVFGIVLYKIITR